MRELLQGDGLSYLLFNIPLEGVIRRVGIDTSGTVFRKSVQLLGFTDDIDIIAGIFEGRLVERVSRESIANRPPRVCMNGNEIKVVH